MNTIQTLIMVAGLTASIPLMADEPATDAAAKGKSAAPAAANPAPPTSAPTQAVEPAPASTAPSNEADADGQLRLNFRGAPLETVLNYLSEAAGFIIVLDTQ